MVLIHKKGHLHIWNKSHRYAVLFVSIKDYIFNAVMQGCWAILIETLFIGHDNSQLLPHKVTKKY